MVYPATAYVHGKVEKFTVVDDCSVFCTEDNLLIMCTSI